MDKKNQQPRKDNAEDVQSKHPIQPLLVNIPDNQRPPPAPPPPPPQPESTSSPPKQVLSLPEHETEEERRKREEKENAEKNELSLIRMFVKHKQTITVANNMNLFNVKQQPKNIDQQQQQQKQQKQQKQLQQNLQQEQKEQKDDKLMKNETDLLSEKLSPITTSPITSPTSVPDSVWLNELEKDMLYRQDNRTMSMVSTGHDRAHPQPMTKKYKLVTSGVLWFCYFSLALNDYIFGPTFNDLSLILDVSFDKIAFFAVYRQIAYTLGSLGGVAFDYVNRQLFLVVLLLLSGGTLLATPYCINLAFLYMIAVLNGFAAGACDIGFHVWILEMFQNGGGPLLQALHFSFGLGIAIAPMITAFFLSSEDACHRDEEDEFKSHPLTNNTQISELRKTLFIPYAIIALIVIFGALIILFLYHYKRYIPPKERELPVSFEEHMPKQLTRGEKLELWKRSLPSMYIISIIFIGSLTIWAYYGLEMTYFQFLAQFSTAVPLPIKGKMSAHLEAATGAAYALGGLIATILSFRLAPEKMIYTNFLLQNGGAFILLFYYQESMEWFWVGNVMIGLGFSSCYATVYTFLEHQINVTNFIGSIFLFAGGSGTAIFPILLANLCANPALIIYLLFFCINFALFWFALMHIITKIRHKQVQLIQDKIMKNPAILTQIKQRTLSQLSFEPQ